MSNLNDAAMTYENGRASGDSVYERALARRKARQAQQTQEVQQEVVEPKVQEETSILGTIGTNIAEIPGQVAGGFLDATKELAQIMEGFVPLGTTTGEEVTEESFLTTDKPETFTGSLARGVSQFLTGFLPAMKGLKAVGVAGKAGKLGKTAAAATGGAIADASVFDPHEERLSNLVESYPALQNPVSEYLSASPDDTEAEGRFKSALEGLVLGGITDTFFSSVKAMKNARAVNKENMAKKRADAKLKADAELAAQEEIEGVTTPNVRIEDALGSGESVKKMSAKQGNKFINDPVQNTEFAVNINMNRIEGEDDVKDVIKKTAELYAPSIDKARRGKQSLEETEKLADSLGMSVDDLLARNKGEAFNAEQAVAARNILVTSADKIVELGKRVASTDATDEDKFAMLKALATHRAIQEQVSGLTAEAGRALSSFRITAKSSKGQAEQIKDILGATGKSVDEIAEQLSMADNITAANKVVENAFKPTKGDIFKEFWINSILSSPATHVVNILGNATTVFWNTGNRFVTPLIGRGFGDSETTIKEAVESLYGAVQGSKDGAILAWKALKSSDVMDDATTLERGEKRGKAITSQALGVSGPFGRAVDYFGSAIRTPGRILTAGDKFFQEVNSRMELRALSYRQAVMEGLTGDAAGKRMHDIMNNPPQELLSEAKAFARVQTFTNDLGTMGSGLQQFANGHPAAKVLLPFIRTPINIIKYVARSSPLAPFSNQFKADVAAGGARRDRALAQMGTGSTIMAVAASMAAEGQISGGGPVNRDQARVLRASGWQPYSVKIGDTWYAYNRLDPVGATLGLGADISEIIGSADDADALDIASAATLAVAKNVASKTYLSGLMNFFEAFNRASADPSKESLSVRNYAQQLAVSFMPFSSLVASVERQVDPTLRDAQTLVEKLKSRTPGYSADLPPTLNIYGEPVVLGGGIGPDMMSPIYTSIQKEDFVTDELVEIGVPITMPPKTIDGVRLSTQEYHDYVKLAGQGVKVGGRNYKQFLEIKMKQRSYQRQSVEGKKEFVLAVTQAFRKKAKFTLLKENTELGLRVKQKRAEKREALRPTGLGG